MDTPRSSSSSTPLGDLLVDSQEPGFDAAEARVVLGPGLARLSPRDRRIVHMRFVEELTQAEIADRMGLTQPHVSRTVQRILDKLRDWLTDEEAALGLVG